MKYRPEIDGLRALAVVPVILFHAGFELFDGGFIGVDVFFVISGYLITTILIEDIENERFSIVKFYERRARRILPALFFVMLVCITFAWLWMLPNELKDFSQSLVAVSLFASNILFWRDSSYFSAAAEENPLLHTWSLAVEEQYYLLFPIFLIMAWRFGKNRVFWMIVVMAAISLLLSEWGWRNAASANFYLAPTRAWELLAGSITAFIVKKRGVRKNNFFALLGLAAIVFSIYSYDESTPFPSVYTLVPVIGAVLLILYAEKKTAAAKLLSTKEFVGIGLISYSAYLWHQPLFAFARVQVIEHPSSTLMSSLSVLALLLAYFTWRYVEAPFRDKRASILSTNGVFVFSGIGIVLFTVVGLTGHFFDGINSRFPPLLKEILDAGEPEKNSCISGKFNNCLLGDGADSEAFVLIGDSHAGRYASIFEKKALQKKTNVRVISGGWCAPLINWRALKKDLAPNSKCFPSMEDELQALVESDVSTVVLAAEWGNYTKGYRYNSNTTAYRYTGKEDVKKPTPYKSFVMALVDTVSYLESINKRVIIITPVPEYNFNVPESLAKLALRNADFSQLRLPISEYLERNSEFFQSLENENLKNVEVLNIEQFFCNQFSCVPYDESGMPLYLDDNHLSPTGLQIIGDYLFNSIVGKN